MLHAAFAVALIALAGTPPAGPAGFVDPLDEPAATSAHAAQRLLTASAYAGQRLVAAGQRGHLVVSDDGGKSWRQAAVPVSTDLTGLSFPSAQRGWAVGHGGVVLTTRDAGQTWTRQLDGRSLSTLLASAARAVPEQQGALREQLTFLAQQGADLPLLDVWFDDERRGTVVGAFNLILHTEDGGATWVPWLERTENPRGLHLYAIRRLGGVLWIAGEQGLLLKHVADRFQPVRTPYEGSFFGLTGSDRAVLSFGLRGNVVRSSDGGATWQRVETGLEVALTGGARAPDGRLLLVSAAGQVLVSRDEGATFSPLAGARPMPTSGVAAGHALVLVGALGARVEPLR